MRKEKLIIRLMLLCFFIITIAGCKKTPNTVEAPFEVAVDEFFRYEASGGDVLVVNMDIINTSKSDYVELLVVSHNIEAKLNDTLLERGGISRNSDCFINSEDTLAAGEETKLQLVYELNGVEAGEVTLVGMIKVEGSDEQVEFLKETINLSQAELKN